MFNKHSFEIRRKNKSDFFDHSTTLNVQKNSEEVWIIVIRRVERDYGHTFFVCYNIADDKSAVGIQVCP